MRDARAKLRVISSDVEICVELRQVVVEIKEKFTSLDTRAAGVQSSLPANDARERPWSGWLLRQGSALRVEGCGK